jgi:hypothetical protein
MSDSVDFYICGNCGNQVPKCNEILHAARCRKVAAVSSAAVVDNITPSVPAPNPSDARSSSRNSNRSSPASQSRPTSTPVIVDITDSDTEDNQHRPRQSAAAASEPGSWTCEACTFLNPSGTSSCRMCDTLNPQLKNAVDNANEDATDPTSWSCSQCTMRNPVGQNQCSMCGCFRNNTTAPTANQFQADADGVRAADPVMRSRLVDDDIDSYPPGHPWANPGFPQPYANDGYSNFGGVGNRNGDTNLAQAMMLGALGGAGFGLLSNRDMMSSALLGAAAGAAGASVYNAMSDDADRNKDRSGSNRNPNASSSGARGYYTRSGSNPYNMDSDAMDIDEYPSSSASRPQPTNVYVDSNGRQFASSSASSAPSRRIVFRSGGMQPDFMQQFEELMMRQPHGGGRATVFNNPNMLFQMFNMGRGTDVDGMSYEQLLEQFSSPAAPTEEGVLQSLPTHVVGGGKAAGNSKNNAVDLSGDSRTSPKAGSSSSTSSSGGSAECANRSCSVCMEEYAPGDTVKTLPCLHQFHCNCIDTWLRQSTVCPVCKYSLRQQR